MARPIESSGRLPRGDWPFPGLLKQSFAAHGLIMLLLAGYMLCLAGLAIAHRDVAANLSPQQLWDVAMALAWVGLPVLVACRFADMALHEAPARPALHLLRNLRALAVSSGTWAAGLPMFASLCLFMLVFGHVKASIAVVRPFAWDETFARWDRALHLGSMPWEWLHPLLGHPPVTLLLNLNYSLWFLVLIAFWLHHAFLARPGVRRTHFHLSFMLSWMIGGSLWAILFSSAGPCYFGRGGLGLSPDPYEGLMSYLASASDAVPLQALDMQKSLWQRLGESMPFGGVSAMPSMHNGSALLFLLFSGGLPRVVRYLLIVHVVLVFLGSVHLGWHYAVDAYAAWAIVLIVWSAARPVARWWEGRPAAQRFRRALEAC